MPGRSKVELYEQIRRAHEREGVSIRELAHRPRLVAAIVDRLTFNAHIIETGTKSYRLRTTRTRRTKTA